MRSESGKGWTSRRQRLHAHGFFRLNFECEIDCSTWQDRHSCQWPTFRSPQKGMFCRSFVEPVCWQVHIQCLQARTLSRNRLDFMWNRKAMCSWPMRAQRFLSREQFRDESNVRAVCTEALTSCRGYRLHRTFCSDEAILNLRVREALATGALIFYCGGGFLVA